MNEKDNFHTISKTANIIGVQAHVLRFWEKKFFMIKPKKSSSGRRYYSSIDIKNLLMIKKLLYEQGFTIKGAIKLINKKYKEKLRKKKHMREPRRESARMRPAAFLEWQAANFAKPMSSRKKIT